MDGAEGIVQYRHRVGPAREMHDAIAFHLEGLREAGEPIPEPSDFTAAYVQVAA